MLPTLSFLNFLKNESAEIFQIQENCQFADVNFLKLAYFRNSKITNVTIVTFHKFSTTTKNWKLNTTLKFFPHKYPKLATLQKESCLSKGEKSQIV